MNPPADPEATATAGAAGRLARLHLGTGLLRLARVELEELAGEGRLDADGVLDLAEARWRTGDLRGAAEAAGAWLEAGAATGAGENGGRPGALAHALVAEGLAVRGREDDAVVHVAATLDALGAEPTGPAGSQDAARSLSGALDALFAGIAPRAEAWPAFEPRVLGASADARAADAAAADGAPAAAASPGGWSSGAVARVPSREAGAAAPDPIAAADDRLAAGEDSAAAVLLILALRATPLRALDVLGRADAALSERSSAGLLLARAEALRVLGRHDAAGIAYAVADAHARGGAPAASPAPVPDASDPPADRDAGADAAAAADPERSPE
ncbi:MAG TPA: hypothetical protein VFC97_04660 [Verrucomicrobiae bacterium]|nr:hypothetical protein [Verrucomicrobiae bacterium]